MVVLGVGVSLMSGEGHRSESRVSSFSIDPGLAYAHVWPRDLSLRDGPGRAGATRGTHIAIDNGRLRGLEKFLRKESVPDVRAKGRARHG